MDINELSGIEKIDNEGFNLACDFGEELQRGRTRGSQFLDRLVDIILLLSLVSDVMI